MTEPRPDEVPLVELFTTGPGCILCERAWALLRGLEPELRFRSRKRVLEPDSPVPADYVFRVPVIHVAGAPVIEGRVEGAALADALRRAGVSERPTPPAGAPRRGPLCDP